MLSSAILFVVLCCVWLAWQCFCSLSSRTLLLVSKLCRCLRPQLVEFANRFSHVLYEAKFVDVLRGLAGLGQQAALPAQAQQTVKFAAGVSGAVCVRPYSRHTVRRRDLYVVCCMYCMYETHSHTHTHILFFLLCLQPPSCPWSRPSVVNSQRGE